MLIKLVMFNSILSSASSFFFLHFYVTEVKFFSVNLIFLFTLHVALFHVRFHVYFLPSLFSLHFINCVCRVPCLYELCSLLFSFTYIHLQFPFPLFFTVYLNFGLLFPLRVKFNCLLSVNFL
jgi:hypothetical protein